MPIGTDFGWGICGQYLTKELAELCDVRLVSEDFGRDRVGDNTTYDILKSLCLNAKGPKTEGVPALNSLDGPVLQTVRGPDLRPWLMEAQGRPTIGYTFFETNRLKKEDVERAKAYYDVLVAGSSWCEGVLRRHGIKHTQTIVQGIDQQAFCDRDIERSYFKDKFVIFSGGKLELRKGQDLVIRAFKVLQDKYSDVLLVTLWFNPWPACLRTMCMSPYIRFDAFQGDYGAAMNHVLRDNGVDPSRAVHVIPTQHRDLARIYGNTDVGLFPNRCEGGTNLVLMEYMACGKPAIASYCSGHRDILTRRNSIQLRELHPFNVQDQGGRVLYNWQEPSLDEIVSALEWAYENRDTLRVIGQEAGACMRRFTWKRAASAFYDLAYERC